MKVFLTGATGYIGGSVAEKLLAVGHEVTGLVRTQEGAAKLRERGIQPLLGTLADHSLLADAARWADAVINAADADNRDAVEAMLPALKGTGKTFIQTSGSSIVGDKAAGEPTDRIFDDETPFDPVPEKMARIAIDRLVLDAAQHGIRTIVICPCLIYGRGLGLHKESIQLPMLMNQARKSGIPRYIGRGENIWSTVHIDDLADLYVLALEQASTGSFFFAENGEARFKDMVQAISRLLGMGGVAASWSLDEAIREWGFEAAVFALGSNSRVRSVKSRTLLGWTPRGQSVIFDIEHGSYRDAAAQNT